MNATASIEATNDPPTEYCSSHSAETTLATSPAIAKAPASGDAKLPGDSLATAHATHSTEPPTPIAVASRARAGTASHGAISDWLPPPDVSAASGDRPDDGKRERIELELEVAHVAAPCGQDRPL